MRTETMAVLGRPALIHSGGAGEAVVLVHGGWGGAASHWDRVWGPLAERFRVLAPELPGVGDLSQPGLGTVLAYARWIESFLDVTGVRAAALVGNSFGAAAVWALAARSPRRCRALVLVNGAPLPSMPPFVQALGRFRLTRAAMRRVLRWNTYSARARAQAFAFPERLPPELSAAFDHPSPRRLDAVLDVLVHGGEEARPASAPLLVWGERDRFPATHPRVARRLHAALPGSRLVLVPDAGHLPQLENPGAFLEALIPFLEAQLVPGASVRV